METFKIEVKETLSRLVEINANTIDEAFLIIRKQYQKEIFVLDNNDIVSTDFLIVED